jgi:AcrR family transcriptional regulator
VARSPATDRKHSPHGEDRRADIVREAERLFATHGYALTRMTDIATAAGITKGLLYWYFDSKEALITEILVHLRQELRYVQKRVIADIDDPLAQIYAGTVASVAFVLDNFQLFAVSSAIGDNSEVVSVTAESSRVHARDAAALIAAGQQAGTIRDDDPLELALADAGVVDRICYLAATGALRGRGHACHFAARYVVHSLAASRAHADEVIRQYGSTSVRRRQARKLPR